MLTFKDYLDSKRQMVEMLQQAPSTTIKYTPIKYGSLKLNEKVVGIKCSQTIAVTWKWNNDNELSIIECCIYDKNNQVVSTGIPTLDADRMQRWLTNNTTVL